MTAVWLDGTAARGQAAGPTGKTRLAGVVIDGSSTRGVGAALVSLRSRSGEARDCVTDSSGHFAFENVSPSEGYTLTATKSGYFPGTYPQGAPSRPVPASLMSYGAPSGDVRITVWPHSAISGSITDEHGEPLPGASLTAFPCVRAGVRLRCGEGLHGRVDDRGVYRIGRLAAGVYVVVMTPPQQMRAYPPLFFADTRAADTAQWVTLGAGEERPGVDFATRPWPVAPLAGKVDGVPQVAFHGLTVKLVAPGSDVLGMEYVLRSAPVQADGTFRFGEVPLGAYRLSVAPAPPFVSYETNSDGILAFAGMAFPDITPGRDSGGAPISQGLAYVGHLDIDVPKGGVTNVLLPLHAAGRATGRIVVEGDTSKLRPNAAVLVRAESHDGNSSAGIPHALVPLVGPAASFSLDGFVGGRYVFHASPPRGLALKSVTYGGRDYTDEPLEVTADVAKTDIIITFTDKVTSLSGVVRNDRAEAARSACVVVFPVQPQLWVDYGMSTPRIMTTRADEGGTYGLTGLPAGEYYVVAPAACGRRTDDSEVLRDLARAATRVTVAWGVQATLDLELKDR
jgi:hypothetical protein